MKERQDPQHHGLLFSQLRWFMRLRWGAGGAVVLAGLVDHYWLEWYCPSTKMAWLGMVILGYNFLLRMMLRSSSDRPGRPGVLMAMAWVQIGADLFCLTLLILWTGGTASPLIGFSVFHMVIASLLLPRVMAYGGAAIMAGMLTAGLFLTGQHPAGRVETLVLLGTTVTLLITVYLASNITRSLRLHQRRVLRQNYLIHSMSRKLRRQRQMMAQQDKMAAMGQMAAGIAHEIANPLASMKTLLQLIQRRPERLQGNAGKLKEQIDRINQTVRQLTHFAHPAEREVARVSIEDVVECALQMVQFDRRIQEVQIHVRRDIAPGGGQVNARPHALEQVLVNLILNALDAMADQHAPRLDIRLWQRDDLCFIDVTDNGQGIAPEHLDHLFEPFFTTKKIGKGTGLGLAISYSTVHDHGGNMEVQSSGEGAKFTVSLPTADAAQD